MKALNSILFLFFFASSFFPLRSASQATVHSTTGYTVNMVVIPSTILPSTLSCTWGYNYNVRAGYVVTFTGTNIPSALYTLQGYLTCNSQQNFFSLPLHGGIGTATTTSNSW